MYIIICRHKQSFPWTCDKHLFKENLKKKKKNVQVHFWSNYRQHWSAKLKKIYPVKIHSDSNSFDSVESEYDNQIAPSPTNVKEERIKLKSCVSSRKVI